MGKTLSEKVWDAHVVRSAEGEPDLLYIDLHLVHEVTSPQAFEGLRLAGRPVRRTDLTLATEDHNTPTLNILAPIADPVWALYGKALSHLGPTATLIERDDHFPPLDELLAELDQARALADDALRAEPCS